MPRRTNARGDTLRLRLGSTRGAALVTVLWATSLLAVLTAGFGQSSRSEAILARNALESAKARMLADAGTHAALFDLLKAETAGAPLTIADRRLAMGEGEAWLLTSDEDGKIDINAAPVDLLAELIASIGIDGSLAALLAERIGDARNFVQIDDLIDVPGMTNRLVEQLRPHVTVLTGVETVAPEAASALVLGVLTGANSALAAEIHDQGIDSETLASLPDDQRLAIEDYLLSSRALVYRIETKAETAGGGRFVRRAIIALDAAERGRPFTVHRWERGDLAGFELTRAAYGRTPVPPRR